MNRLPRMYEVVRSSDGFTGSAEGFDAGEVRVYDSAGRFRFFKVADLEPVVTPEIVLSFRADDDEDWDGYPENLGPQS